MLVREIKIDAVGEIFGVVVLLECAGHVLEQLLVENFGVALREDPARGGLAPHGGAQEERVGDVRFASSVEERRRLDEVGERHPLTDGNVDVVVVRGFGKASDDVENVLGKRDLLDFAQPLAPFFGGDGEFLVCGEVLDFELVGRRFAAGGCCPCS